MEPGHVMPLIFWLSPITFKMHPTSSSFMVLSNLSLTCLSGFLYTPSSFLCVPSFQLLEHIIPF